MQGLPAFGDRYAVRSLIGSGATGRVYLADDLKHNRQVAIKLLEPALASMLTQERFLREVSITARLLHPNIVALYDSGEFDGEVYYVMPYVEGGSLRERIRRDGALPIDTALAWARELADALAHAHKAGFIHRDIKPANILIQAEHVLLADFGIARAIDLAGGESLTSSGMAMGTPAYMSPEQAYGEIRVDARTDVFSLGCVLYEMLAGEQPFGGLTAQSITAKKLAGHYAPLAAMRPEVPAHVDRLIKRALAPNAADRFQTITDFGASLAHRPKPAFRRIVAGIVIASLLGTLSWKGYSLWRLRASGLDPNRVVVGVFENRTGDPRHDRLGQMAADWVTDGLQRTGSVQVVPTASTLAAERFLRGQYRGDPVRALADETGARFVITGALYRERDSVVFHAQVVDALTGRLMGAVDPIQASDSNPGEGLTQLRARLTGLLALRLDERVAPAGALPSRPPLYAAYRAFNEGMDSYVGNEYAPALLSFQRAFQLDSTFLLPLLYASICHTNMGSFAAADSILRIVASRRTELSDLDRQWLEYSQAELRGANGAALAAIRTAAVMAPASKAVYNFAVQALQSRMAYAAESALRRVSPNRGPMRGWAPYWFVLTAALHVQGKHVAELEAARTAKQQYPHRVDVSLLEIRALAALGRANEVAQSIVEMERLGNQPGLAIGGLSLEAASELWAHGDSAAAIPLLNRARGSYAAGIATGSVDAKWGMMQTAGLLGSWDEAVALGKQLVRVDSLDSRFQGALGVAMVRIGKDSDARATKDRLVRDSQPYSFGNPQFAGARIAAALGDSNEAIALIERAYARGYVFELGPHRDPALGSLRFHPLVLPSSSARR